MDFIGKKPTKSKIVMCNLVPTNFKKVIEIRAFKILHSIAMENLFSPRRHIEVALVSETPVLRF